MCVYLTRLKMQYPINGWNVFFFGGGGDVNLKNLANIHLGVVTTRKFCLRYESILDPPMPCLEHILSR